MSRTASDMRLPPQERVTQACSENRPEGPVTRPSYDLATPAFDYDCWEGPPKRTILLCSHMRSGSTLLGEAMFHAGGLGCPIEYFHSGFRPGLQKAWGVEGDAAYVEAVYRHRTDAGGTFGVKLFWPDLLELCNSGEPDQARTPQLDLAAGEPSTNQANARILEIIRRIFPSPIFVFLERRDRLRLAVSHWLSAQTGIWRDLGEGSCPTRQIPARYDYETIARLYAAASLCFEHWKAFFRYASIEPLAVTYEDLSCRYEATVVPLLERLGANATHPRQPRLRRQASQRSEQFAVRFLREHADRRSSPI